MKPPPSRSENCRFSGKDGSRDGEGHAVDTGLAEEGPGTAQVAAGFHYERAILGEEHSGGVQGPRMMIGFAIF